MIDYNVYEDVMNEWANPHQGCCSGTMTIAPDTDMKRWAVQQTVTILANADYYYTKFEIDKIIEEVTASGVTPAQVEEMIQRAIATKADKEAVDTLSAQVQSQAAEILNRYTKQEVDSLLGNFYDKLQINGMFANYTKVEGDVLSLNDENITI